MIELLDGRFDPKAVAEHIRELLEDDHVLGFACCDRSRRIADTEAFVDRIS